ncbi:MAG: YIP1 family protein [Acholeplasmataceae bacterium]|nr:YIP1 family protein [Acholeplasmataceae bacterium]HQD92210.1 Yip1 family protein [Bacilli bacterium]
METVEVTKNERKIDLYLQKTKTFFRYVYNEYIKFPLYILTHPLKGFDEFKREKRAKMSVSIVFIIITIILQILRFEYEGFLVNDRNINDLNSLAEIAYVIAPIVLCALANWSITTLFDGKGTFKEIFMMISYSLFPLFVTGFIGLILSNILTQEEIALYYLVTGIGKFLTGFMIFFGLISIHEYGLAKTILTIVATAVALMVILFVLLLSFDLFQRVYGFIYTIYHEVSLRYV